MILDARGCKRKIKINILAIITSPEEGRLFDKHNIRAGGGADEGPDS